MPANNSAECNHRQRVSNNTPDNNKDKLHSSSGSDVCRLHIPPYMYQSCSTISQPNMMQARTIRSVRRALSDHNRSRCRSKNNNTISTAIPLMVTICEVENRINSSASYGSSHGGYAMHLYSPLFNQSSHQHYLSLMLTFSFCH